MIPSAHTDSFARDNLPLADQQPDFLLDRFPYPDRLNAAVELTDAMVANLDNFKELTGMEVKYDVFPEDVYFDKVTAALSSRSRCPARRPHGPPDPPPIVSRPWRGARRDAPCR